MDHGTKFLLRCNSTLLIDDIYFAIGDYLDAATYTNYYFLLSNWFNHKDTHSIEVATTSVASKNGNNNNDNGSIRIMAKFDFDELLYNIEKQGYDLINGDGSLYNIEQGA